MLFGKSKKPIELEAEEAVKQPRKVALINVHDYPKKLYSAYWEIRVDGDNETGYYYGVRLYHYNTGKVICEKLGATRTRDEADTEAQTWVLEEIKKYRRIH